MKSRIAPQVSSLITLALLLLVSIPFSGVRAAAPKLSTSEAHIDACEPNGVISDAVNDVSIAYIDVTSVQNVLDGETLRTTFHLRDVPAQLTFNRPGVPVFTLEYQWEVAVDVDNNANTGSPDALLKGADFRLSASYTNTFLGAGPINQAIQNYVDTAVWRYSGGSWTYTGAQIAVDVNGDTITLTGNIPGIGAQSQLFFSTFDYNPGGISQRDDNFAKCPPTGGEPSATATPTPVTGGCAPGQVITDPADDVSLAHVDVASLSSTLSGQALQATLRLRDLPAQFTFHSAPEPEYRWLVLVDVDNNPNSGATDSRYRGAEYALLVWSDPYASGTVAAQDAFNHWVVYPDGSGGWQDTSEAVLVVDSAADTMLIRGDIPGITQRSRIFFEAFDYAGGTRMSDQSDMCGTGVVPVPTSTSTPQSTPTPTQTPVQLSSPTAFRPNPNGFKTANTTPYSAIGRCSAKPLVRPMWTDRGELCPCPRHFLPRYKAYRFRMVMCRILVRGKVGFFEVVATRGRTICYSSLSGSTMNPGLRQCPPPSPAMLGRRHTDNLLKNTESGLPAAI